MGATFSIEAKGGEEIERRLSSLQRAFGDLTSLMEIFGTVLESGTLDRFDTETAPDGSAWTKSQRAKDDGGKTLTDTSQLRSSIHSIASSDKVQIGTNKIYAGVHQFGFDDKVSVGKHSRTIDKAFGKALRAPVTFEVDPFERFMKIPARPFLGLSADDAAELLAQADDYARDALGGASA